MGSLLFLSGEKKKMSKKKNKEEKIGPMRGSIRWE